MMGKRKLLDSTYFVSKRMGRVLHGTGLIDASQPVIVALSGGFASAAMLKALVERGKRVPSRPILVPVFIPDTVHGEPLMVAERAKALCASLELDLQVASVAGSVESHFSAVPHAEALINIAMLHRARVVLLGHTLEDRALHVLLAMALQGRLSDMPLDEPLTVAGQAPLHLIRPMGDVTSDVVLQVAQEEALSFSPRLLEPPDAAIRRLFLDFAGAKRGTLMEKLRNVTIAPHRVQDEYLVGNSETYSA